MNIAIAGVIFLVLFAVVMVAVSLGSRFLEVRGRKQVETMLASPTQESERVETTILVDPHEGNSFDKLFQHSPLVGDMQSWIQSAGLAWTPASVLTATLAGVGIGALMGWLFRPLGFAAVSMVLGAALLASLPYFVIQSKCRKRLNQCEEQLPEALDFLARSMRAGHAFSVSLEMLGAESADPMGQEFRTLFNEQNLGAPLEVALANFANRVDLLDVKLFVSAVLLQRQTGGNLSEVLQRLASLVRERFKLRGQVRAASAHGRMTRIVLMILPIVMIFALNFVAPGYLTSMAADPDGKWMILFAVLAQVAGYFIMRRITDIEV